MTNSKPKANHFNKTIKKLVKHDVIKNCLVENSIADIDQVLAINQYQVDQDRSGIIVYALEKDIQEATTIVFDFKRGHPTVNQVYDALYEKGKDCDIKIIVFSYEPNDNDKKKPNANYLLVDRLVDELQELNVPIYLLSYDFSKQKFNGSNMVKNSVDRSCNCLIPSQEKLVFATFLSIYFRSTNLYFPNKKQEYGLDCKPYEWNHKIFMDCEFDCDIELFWDRNGVSFVLTQYDNSDKLIETILDFEKVFLKRKYGNNAVRIENTVEGFLRLYITYNKIPISWLYTAKQKAINEFAMTLFEDAIGLRNKFQTSAQKLFEMGPALV